MAPTSTKHTGHTHPAIRLSGGSSRISSHRAHPAAIPASASGGIPALTALAAAFGGLKFCPTGGISLATAPDWLALPAVACVGGSWLVARTSGSGAPDPAAITLAARAAATLPR